MFGSPVGRRPFANGRGRGRGGAGMAGGWQSQGRGGAQLGRTGGRGGAQGGRFGQQSQQQMQGRKFGQQSMQGGRQQYGQSAQGNKRYWDKVVRPREPSIEIHKSWKQVHTMLLADLIKAKVDAVPEAEDLRSHGHLEQFDSALEQITTRTEKPLRKFEQRQFFTVTTSDDPVLQELTAANEGTIYATDTILGVLMSASRSVYSWDLVVTKTGDTLVWDKRPKSLVDMMTVHETGNEQGLNLDEDASLNHPTHLSAETTAINQNFTQQALLKDSERWVPDGTHESPFVSGIEAGFEAAPVLYRYRRWRMPGGHRLVARTEINGFAQKKGSADKQMVSICALNEFDSKATGAHAPLAVSAFRRIYRFFFSCS